MKISMFGFSMIGKWVRATKIICPFTFDALHMVFARDEGLDVRAKKQTQLPDCIIEFILTTIYDEEEEEEEEKKESISAWWEEE